MKDFETLKALWETNQDVDSARRYIEEMESQIRWLVETLAKEMDASAMKKYLGQGDPKH